MTPERIGLALTVGAFGAALVRDCWIAPRRRRAHRNGIGIPNPPQSRTAAQERQARSTLRTGSADVLPLGAESVPQRIRKHYRNEAAR